MNDFKWLFLSFVKKIVFSFLLNDPSRLYIVRTSFVHRSYIVRTSFVHRSYVIRTTTHHSWKFRSISKILFIHKTDTHFQLQVYTGEFQLEFPPNENFRKKILKFSFVFRKLFCEISYFLCIWKKSLENQSCKN